MRAAGKFDTFGAPRASKCSKLGPKLALGSTTGTCCYLPTKTCSISTLLLIHRPSTTRTHLAIITIIIGQRIPPKCLILFAACLPCLTNLFFAWNTLAVPSIIHHCHCTNLPAYLSAPPPPSYPLIPCRQKQDPFTGTTLPSLLTFTQLFSPPPNLHLIGFLFFYFDLGSNLNCTTK